MASQGSSRVERLRPGAPAGFTLLEVLVALFVMAIGLLGFASLQGVAAKSNANGGVMSRAVSIGESRMDMLKSSRFEDLATSGATPQTLCSKTVQVQTGAGVLDFYTVACTLTPQDTDGDGVEDRVDMLVTVKYPGALSQWPVRVISSRSRR